MLNTIALLIAIPMFASLLVWNLIYFIVVLPTLKKYGQDNSLKFTAWTASKQLENYHNVCVDNKLGLKYHLLLMIFRNLAFVAAFIYLVLIVLSILGIINT